MPGPEAQIPLARRQPIGFSPHGYKYAMKFVIVCAHVIVVNNTINHPDQEQTLQRL